MWKAANPFGIFKSQIVFDKYVVLIETKAVNGVGHAVVSGWFDDACESLASTCCRVRRFVQRMNLAQLASMVH